MTPPTASQSQMGKVLDYLAMIDTKIEKLDAKQDQMSLESTAQNAEIRHELSTLRATDDRQESRIKMVEDFVIEQRQTNKMYGWVWSLVGSAVALAIITALLATIGLPI